MNSINFVPHVVVIGGGPAGLMAAETLAQGGAQVDVFDAMPSVGRKFLLAGKGGLNLTHAEDLPDFLRRYGDKQTAVTSWINEFNPQNCRQWAKQLGVETFVGTSGRVFPQDMKAAPLLRAWLHRMRAKGIRFHMRHRWIGWHEGSLRFSTPNGNVVQRADAVVLALGGASWPQLGSNGAWVPLLQQGGVDIAPLEPTNCGFEVNWSEHFKTNFAGEPLSPIAITYTNEKGTTTRRLGQFVVTEHGV